MREQQLLETLTGAAALSEENKGPTIRTCAVDCRLLLQLAPNFADA